MGWSFILFYLCIPTLIQKAFKGTCNIYKIQLDGMNYFLIKCILVLSRSENLRIDTYEMPLHENIHINGLKI